MKSRPESAMKLPYGWPRCLRKWGRTLLAGHAGNATARKAVRELPARLRPRLADDVFPMNAVLNGRGDLAMDGALRPYIGASVVVLKITRAGLYQIRAADGKLLSVPKRNLTIAGELHA